MSNRVFNVEVQLKNGESTEKLIRRFFKKCKKENIVKDYLDKTNCFRNKREKMQMKIKKNKWLKMKEEKFEQR